MKNVSKLFIATILYLSLPLAVLAGDVEIFWQEPENFRDIEAGNENQVKFQQRVIQELGKHFEDIARDVLPEDQVLYLTITDVDLAGDVEYLFGRFNRQVRIVRDFYFPAISFDYELRSAGDGLIKSGSENIKDMGFMFSGVRAISNPPFNYEKEMIKDWFARNFKRAS